MWNPTKNSTLLKGLANIEIPDDYQWLYSASGREKFLLYDHGQEKADRFLVFSTQADLNRFLLAEVFLGDGTFKIPDDFKQVRYDKSPKFWCT